MEEQVIIYTLTSSENPNNIRYIGKTYNTKKRLLWHLSETKKKDMSYKINWIRKELAENNKIIIEEVDKVPLKDWGFWEEFYINLFKSWGFNLTNLAKGGNTGDYKNKKSTIHKMTKVALERTRGVEFTEDEIEEHIKNKEVNKERLGVRAANLVILYLDKITGEVLGEAKSTKEAGNILNISYKKIQECLKGEASSYYKGTKKVRHSYKGYIFLYKKDYNKDQDYRISYRRNRAY